MTFHPIRRSDRALTCLSSLTAIGALVAIALTPALSGCGSGGRSVAVVESSPTPGGPVTATGRYQNLVFTLTAPKQTYAKGEIVTLTFTVQNTGTSDVTYQNASPPDVGGEVRTPEGALVNDFSELTAYGETKAASTAKTGSAATRLTQTYIHSFPAGQTRTYTLRWDQSNGFSAPAAQVPSGTYNIRGLLGTSQIDGVTLTQDQVATGYLQVVIQ